VRDDWRTDERDETACQPLTTATGQNCCMRGVPAMPAAPATWWVAPPAAALGMGQAIQSAHQFENPHTCASCGTAAHRTSHGSQVWNCISMAKQPQAAA
jgi:hypothetical protein